MSDTPVNLSYFDNEDFVEDFVIKSGASSDAAVPFDLTGAVFSIEFADKKTGKVVLRLASDETSPNGYLTITDAAAGKFSLRINRLTLKAGAPIVWDCLMLKSTVTKRLFGGRLIVKDGTTN